MSKDALVWLGPTTSHEECPGDYGSFSRPAALSDTNDKACEVGGGPMGDVDFLHHQNLIRHSVT
jgi:hypothetical protein